MGWFSVLADVAGVISFGIGIGTFFTTLRIREKIKDGIDKAIFIREIDEKIQNLSSYLNSIEQDDELYTKELLDKIDDRLDEIIASHETVLSGDLPSKIKDLQDLILKCRTDLTDEIKKRQCVKQLNIVIQKLKRGKIS